VDATESRKCSKISELFPLFLFLFTNVCSFVSFSVSYAYVFYSNLQIYSLIRTLQCSAVVHVSSFLPRPQILIYSQHYLSCILFICMYFLPFIPHPRHVSYSNFPFHIYFLFVDVLFLSF
jgi:hypothetical protein